MPSCYFCRALRRVLSASRLAIVLIASASAAAAMAQSIGPQWQTAPREVQFARGEVIKAKDHRGLPFAIVDKKTAQLFVFNSAGHLQGAAPVLLGLAPGDFEAVEPVASDTQSLSADRRTTPAGRFISEPGRNLAGEAIVWMDYAARLAIHRLRPAAISERRPERLASSTPDDNRITLGCVVVAPHFYDTVVAPVMGKSYGVVYVLPENDSLERLHAIAP